MFQILHIVWTFWIYFGKFVLKVRVSRGDIIFFGIQRFEKFSPQVLFSSWLSLYVLCLRKSGLLFYSGTLYHLFHQKLFHISPSEIQSLLQVQSQLALSLWSFLHDTHPLFFQTFKILSTSCGIYFLLCVVWPCLFFGRNCILFIYWPWKCLAP